MWLYDDFLSEQECDGLMRVHDSHVQMYSKHDPFICFSDIETLRKHLKAVQKSKVKVTPRDFMPGLSYELFYRLDFQHKKHKTNSIDQNTSIARTRLQFWGKPNDFLLEFIHNQKLYT